MFRGSRLRDEPDEKDGFRLRGKEVSRIEGFTDAVFGFALTLLVVSLNIPKNTSELIEALKGAPVFGVCFVLLYLLWNSHYTFSRRYGLHDATVRALTGFLLFTVLMFVYPLKFLFTLFLNEFLGLNPTAGGRLPPGDIATVFVVYGIGFVATLGTFALLYRHAFHLRKQLDLNPLETFLTRSAALGFILVAMVGVVSVLLAVLLPGYWKSAAGFIYATIGIVAWRHGVWEAAKASLISRSAPRSELLETQVVDVP